MFCKITHYETLARDADLINAWAPDLVIADEAQRIKNWHTVAARALKRISSPYAVVLTGTPLENRLEELVSIVQFVDQHRLGPTWRLLDEHQMRDEAGRVVGYRALDRISQTLAPVMLRRRKAEVLEDPSAKAVVFSQWKGTYELIQRRLARRQHDASLPVWKQVLFSGSVPGDKRGALVDQFHNDPAYRLFLSTDAGGVGLNLQHAAAVVVNMDLPWNPAVLEQRIGRVHRMGQSRGVQVVNFVGQGSIEEGMLATLAFKKSPD